MRRKYDVTFTIELDVIDGGIGWFDEVVAAEKPTVKKIEDHVYDLEWSGGCAHPAFALHSNRNIKVSKVKARLAK